MDGDSARSPLEARREYLEGLLKELREQRKVDVDQALMELTHFVFELDDELEDLRSQVAKLTAAS